MTKFLDLRLQPVGGELAASVSICQGTNIANYTGLLMADFLAAIRGRHMLMATHGFNVNRADGVACLSNWDGILQLPQASAFVGLLWPGDSIWGHGLDYPAEPRVADRAGALLARFIDANFGDAASVSFASHSLGARVVLSTIAHLKRPVRRLTLMAGAVDDNCLSAEFSGAAGKVESISVLASRKDTVLSQLFPIGNFFAGILDKGHPWWHAAIGHLGPQQPWPANFRPPFEISDAWGFNHGDYLRITQPPAPAMPLPVEVPPQGTAEPTVAGWHEAFSSAFESTRFR